MSVSGAAALLGNALAGIRLKRTDARFGAIQSSENRVWVEIQDDGSFYLITVEHIR